MICQQCGITLKESAKYQNTKVCRKCYETPKRNHCEDCGKELSRRQGIKRCILCSNRHKALDKNFCKKLSETVKDSWKKLTIRQKHMGRNNPMFGKIVHGVGSYYKKIWMRSGYEIKFAKFLDLNNVKWNYEPKVFDLVNMTYRPDFYLPQANEYIEIKGYWREDAKLKFNLFKLFYPQEKITVLQKEDLKQMEVL